MGQSLAGKNCKQKRKNLKKMTQEELEKLAENLYYVIWMLNGTATLEACPKSVDKVLEDNAFLESFLVHTRILIEFFYGVANDKDTVLAKNFVDNWENYRDKDDRLAIGYLDEIRKRAHKLLAHLTKKGSLSNDQYRRWDRITIRDEINRRIKCFLDLPDNNIPEDIKSKILDILEKNPPRD